MSPQNGGFIRAKSGPLIRHQARILYLLILWATPSHGIEINHKSNSMSAPLKFMSSRMSPRASHRRHQYAILASSQNVSLRNRKMSLKGQKCQGRLPGWRQYGVLMAYFGHAHWKKGTSIHESWTSSIAEIPWVRGWTFGWFLFCDGYTCLKYHYWTCNKFQLSSSTLL